MTGSRLPARDAEEGHQRRQDSREDEGGEAGGGRQPDAAGQEGQDQEQPAEAGRAGEGPPGEPLSGPHQRHSQGNYSNKQTGHLSTFNTISGLLKGDVYVLQDIRNQRRYRQRRKAELVRLQQTNAALNSKTNFYNVQIDSYNQYIKTCMDNLARKGK